MVLDIHVKNIILILMVVLSGCATQDVINTASKDALDSGQQTPSTAADPYLNNAYELLTRGSTKKAMVEIDKALDICKKQYAHDKNRVYASRGLAETLFYMTKAAAESQDAIAVAPTCADALYLKGYASLDMGQIEAAEDYLQRAVDMAPVNSMYLAELGHIHHVKRDWQGALKVFERAEAAANAYSPEEIKDRERSRAKRGIGYSLIELGRLDEAEKKFLECLAINSEDESAQRELEYIKDKRKQES